MRSKWRAGSRWWARLLEVFGHRCAYCRKEPGRKGWTVDHVIPLSKGGTWRMENLVPACAKCNNEKSSHELPLWMAKRGLDVVAFRELRDVWCTLVWESLVPLENSCCILNGVV